MASLSDIGKSFGGAIGAIGGALIGGSGAKDINSAQLAAMGGNQEFLQYNSDTAYQRAVRDMQFAGLNPMLAYSQGGASTPGAPAVPKLENPGMAAVAGAQSGAGVAVALQQMEKTSAETRKVEAETSEVVARTPIHAQTLINMKGKLDEIVANIGLIRQQTETSGQSAAQAYSQIQLNQQMINQSKQVVEQLASIINLNEAQIKNLAAQTGKTEQDIQHMKQVVAANLPDIQQKLAQVETQIKRYHETGARLTKEGMENLGGLLSAINLVSRAMTGRGPTY